MRHLFSRLRVESDGQLSLPDEPLLPGTESLDLGLPGQERGHDRLSRGQQHARQTGTLE